MNSRKTLIVAFLGLVGFIVIASSEWTSSATSIPFSHSPQAEPLVYRTHHDTVSEKLQLPTSGFKPASWAAAQPLQQLSRSHDTSPRLQDMIQIPVRPNRNVVGREQVAVRAQNAAAVVLASVSGSDTEVGSTQHVKLIDNSFQIFDNLNDTSLLGPLDISTIWTGAGSPCESGGTGNAIVVYDKLADRWIISQFASKANGKLATEECFAVSTTGDARGSYYRYSFNLGTNFIDSPHVSVRPDAYVMGDSVFDDSGTERIGSQFFMFDRSAMLAGDAATWTSPGVVTEAGETYSISANGVRVISGPIESAVGTLTINLAYDADSVFINAGLSAADIANMKAANAYAASQFTNNFRDPINVNIHVTAVPGTNTLGQSSVSAQSVTFANLRAKIIADARTADDTTATGAGGSVPTADPVSGAHNFYVPPAQLKAMGIAADSGTTPSDGTYTFGGGYMYTYDPQNRAVPGKYDYIGVSMHEFSEIMGRIGGMGKNLDNADNAVYLLYDLFHYTGAGARALDDGPGRSFSIDNGTTLLKAFNNPNGGKSDLADWASGTNDSFNAFSNSSVQNNLTAVDLRVMDVIGYDFAGTGSGCTYTITPSSQNFGSSGANGSFSVNTSSGCTWAAMSNATWITTSSSGSGNGTVNFAVAANTGPARTGTITVNGQTFTVSQGAAAGGGCPSTTISVGQTINGTLTTSDCIFSGTTRYVDVYNFSGTAGQQIAVAMNSSVFDTYLYLLDSSNTVLAQNDDGGGGTNSRIPATSGGFTLPATGSFTIYATSFSADGTTGSTGAYTITLSSGTCSYALSSSSQTFGSNGGSGSFGVTTSSGCAWTAISNANWITTSSSGSGNGTVNFTVAANTGASRTGTISVGGQTFTISQSAGGGCPSTTISAGHTINGTLTTSDCIFSGTTRYVDVYNFSGTAGQQVVVGMNSSVFDTYLYLLDASNQLLAQDDDGGGGTNSRIPPSGAFTLPATGTFTIYATSYSPDGTTGATGAYTISLSNGTCSYALSSSGQSFGSTGGSGSVGVTTSSGCAWAAVSNASWVTTSSSGSGNGTLNFSVAANTGAARTGTISVNGQSFTVSQAAASINVTVQTNPSGRAFTVDGLSFNSTQTFSWTSGSSHTITSSSPQSGTTGTQYVWGNWSDGGAITHAVAPSSNTTYTANFTTQYFLTMNAGTGGTVSPSNGYFNSGQSVSISASPNSGYSFTGWSGSGTGSYSGTNNPASVTMSGPITEAANFTQIPTPTTVQFSATTVQANESDGHATITVTRTGNTSAASTVDVRTNDDTRAIRCDDTASAPGVAFARCDYATVVQTLTFAPGETAKSFVVPIIDDSFVEPDESVRLALSNPTNATLGAQSTTLLVIHDNDTPGEPNPITRTDQIGTQFFVREQYLDFLSREPDAAGMAAWAATLSNCAAGDLTCDRVAVSRNFFLSTEFQLKGLFVFKFYKVSFARLPLYSEMVADMSSVTGDSTPDLIAKKAAFTSAWARRAEFAGAFGATSNQTFVDTLMNRYSLQSITTINPGSPDDTSQANRVTLSRTDLVNRLNAGTLTRGQVVRAMADSNEVSQAEFNPAFVAMQYFGYLRRDPEPQGYANWLATINANPSDVRSMVSGFVNSTEYRLRFGQP